MSGHSLHSFEEVHYDTYEYYNLTDYRAGKGRRRNTGQNYRQQRGGGRGRRVAEALFNSELKRKRLRASHQVKRSVRRRSNIPPTTDCCRSPSPALALTHERVVFSSRQRDNTPGLPTNAPYHWPDPPSLWQHPGKSLHLFQSINILSVMKQNSMCGLTRVPMSSKVI